MTEQKRRRNFEQEETPSVPKPSKTKQRQKKAKQQDEYVPIDISEYKQLDEYPVELQREIVETLSSYRMFHKDVHKLWKVKLNQIKVAIYRGYSIPEPEVVLLTKSETIENEDTSTNLIKFYNYIASRWEYIRDNIDNISDHTDFRILFYTTYLTQFYKPLPKNTQVEILSYKPKTYSNVPMCFYYTQAFTQNYINNFSDVLTEYMNISSKFSCCIVSDVKPKKTDIEKINGFKAITSSDDVTINFSFMNSQELVLDVFNHILNPVINICSQEEKKDLLERETHSKTRVKRLTQDQLPQILRTDMISRLLNLKVGNIITVDNVNLSYEAMCQTSRVYRSVVNTDVVKKSR